MKIPSWLKRLFKHQDFVKDRETDQKQPIEPLREFIYLDEVSLRSLLSSQTGEMTETKSQQSIDALETEASANVGVNAGMVAKAELASHFQTTNSSTIQTSRKATVQSWFREFYNNPKLRLIQPPHDHNPVGDTDALKEIEDPAILIKSNALRRGSLVEFKVRLNTDPVFRLKTMVSEFSAMAEDYPEMFATGTGSEILSKTQPIEKILERLLTGLIPIRAEAIDYSVVVIDDVEYIVANEVLGELDLDRQPLEIVGVTEHLAYWKDIRRVLFSDAEFTILGRVGRDALHDTWTPVKLADLFKGIAPDLVSQINSASTTLFDTTQILNPKDTSEARLGTALQSYAEALLQDSNITLSTTQQKNLDGKVESLRTRTSSVSDQRSAFQEVNNFLVNSAGIEIDANKDLECRESARSSAGLSLFPTLNHTSSVSIPSSPSTNSSSRPRLLDIEIIAIYW